MDAPMDVPLFELPRVDRFAELAALQPGWLDGDGAAVPPAAIECAQHVIIALTPLLGDPGVFPMIEGGVSLEWVGGLPNIRTVEIDGGQTMSCLDLATGDDTQTKLVSEVVAFFRDRP